MQGNEESAHSNVRVLTAGRGACLSSQGRFFLKGTKGSEDTKSLAMETTRTDVPVTRSQFSQGRRNRGAWGALC